MASSAEKIDRTAAQVDQLLAQLAVLQARIQQLEIESEVEKSSAADSDTDIKPHFANVGDFTDRFVRVVYRTPTMTTQNQTALWCKQWEKHEEVELLIIGLWKTYEQARAEDWPTHSSEKMMSWFSQTFNPTMAYVCRPDGPFALCANGHTQSALLGDITTPAGMSNV